VKCGVGVLVTDGKKKCETPTAVSVCVRLTLQPLRGHLIMLELELYSIVSLSMIGDILGHALPCLELP